MKNKFIQALTIPIIATIVGYIPVAGECLSYIVIIGLFIYFSKEQSKYDDSYSTGSGVKFGLLFGVASALCALIFVPFTFEETRNMLVDQFRGEESLDEIAQTIADMGLITGTMLFAGIGLIINSIIGLILGLVSGLIFSRDEEAI